MHTNVLLMICTLVGAAAVTPCHRSLIKADGGTLLEHLNSDQTAVEGLQCKSDLERISFNSTPYYAITCNSLGWMGKREGLGSNRNRIEFEPVKLADAEAQLDISCVKYCTTQADEKVRIRDSKKFKYVKVVVCKDASHDLFINGQRVSRNQAACAPWEGWILNYPYRLLAANVLEPQHFECRKAPPACTYHHTDGILFDDVEKIISCEERDNSIRQLEFNGRHFPSLHCKRRHGERSTDWFFETTEADGSRADYWIADGSSILYATCVEYCTTTGEGITINKVDSTVKVTCTEPTSFLSYGGTHWTTEAVECSLNGGWTNSNNELISENITTAFPLECRKACTLLNDGEMILSTKSNKWTCADTSASVTKIMIGSAQYDALTCDRVNGWSDGFNGWSDGYKKIAEPHTPLNATCAKYCTSTGNATLSRHIHGITAECKDPDFGIRSKSKMYVYLHCDENSGWKANNWTHEYTIAEPSESIHITCEKYPPSCFVPQFEGIEYDQMDNELLCTGIGIRRIQFNSKSYSYLKCSTANGWAGAVGVRLEYIAEAQAHVNVTCAEHCALAGTGFTSRIKKLIDYLYLEVTCTGRDVLFHDGMRVESGKASCDPGFGWYETRDSLIRNDTITPMQFECRPGPTTTTTTTSTTISIPATTGKTTRPVTQSITQSPIITTSSTEVPVASADAQSSPTTTIAVCVTALVVVIILAALIFVVCMNKRKQAENSENNGTDRKAEEWTDLKSNNMYGIGNMPSEP